MTVSSFAYADLFLINNLFCHLLIHSLCLIASYSRDEDEEERVYKYKELISAGNNFSGGDKTNEISEH
ncbi:MAG: hypothetical protein JWO95_2344 [Verrucomicrobiales bacterium]|nr:hypothetical protein [Verrucomicrobiales bacterium]